MSGVVGRVGSVVAVCGLVAGLAPSASGSSQGDVETNRFVVVVDRGDPGEVAADHRWAHGGEVHHVYRHALRGYAARMSEEAAERLPRDDRVAYVDRDTEVRTVGHRCADSGPGGPDDACGDGDVARTITDDGGVVDDDTWAPSSDDVGSAAETVPWGVARTGAAGLHDDGLTGAGTDVYIIDTGIKADHPDLEPNLGEGHAVVGCLDLGCEEDWDDDQGHGTHVAGIAGATDAGQVVGMAPDVTLHAVKVLNRLGIGWTSDVIAGIDWVAAREEGEADAAVANMSLGASGQKSGACTDAGFVGVDSYHEAVCVSTHEGVVFSVAAGNDDEDAERTVPAAYHDTALAASATDPHDDFAEFSNWGDDPFFWAVAREDQPAPESAPVALAAPGVAVESTWLDGTTRELSGTSMAAPHVGGGAALFAAARGLAGDGRQAFLDARASLMGESEDTGEFDDASTYDGDRQEGFLDLRFLER